MWRTCSLPLSVFRPAKSDISVWTAARGADGGHPVCRGRGPWLPQFLSRTPCAVRAGRSIGSTSSSRRLQCPPGYLYAQQARIPTGRKGDPRELAATVVFLASAAAGYITARPSRSTAA